MYSAHCLCYLELYRTYWKRVPFKTSKLKKTCNSVVTTTTGRLKEKSRPWWIQKCLQKLQYMYMYMLLSIVDVRKILLFIRLGSLRRHSLEEAIQTNCHRRRQSSARLWPWPLAPPSSSCFWNVVWCTQSWGWRQPVDIYVFTYQICYSEESNQQYWHHVKHTYHCCSESSWRHMEYLSIGKWHAHR